VLSEEESNQLYDQWTIPAHGKPLFEAAVANFSLHSPDKINTANEGRGPLLLMMGGHDHTVPEAITKSTVKQYRHSSAVTDLEEFSDRGHSLTIDHGWREVADAARPGSASRACDPKCDTHRLRAGTGAGAGARRGARGGARGDYLRRADLGSQLDHQGWAGS
jgi:hypothetical protein